MLAPAPNLDNFCTTWQDYVFKWSELHILYYANFQTKINVVFHQKLQWQSLILVITID